VNVVEELLSECPATRYSNYITFENCVSRPPSSLLHLYYDDSITSLPTRQTTRLNTTQSTLSTAMDSEYRKNAGRAHHDLEQSKIKEEADHAAALRRGLQNKLGEDISHCNIPESGQSSSRPLACQASGSSSGQLAQYSTLEWARMHRMYDMGREREREGQAEQRRRPRSSQEPQNANGYSGESADVWPKSPRMWRCIPRPLRVWAGLRCCNAATWYPRS
jgi:hypothetical protein